MRPCNSIKQTIVLWTAGLVLMMAASAAWAQTPETFAALPFSIHSDKNMDYVKKGISRMLYSRLSWPGKVAVVPPAQMDKVLAPLSGKPTAQLVTQVAERTGSDYVMFGTITRFADSFSIDAKVFDIENKRYMAFSQRSDNSDDLIQKVDRIAASINQRIFKRSTVTWEEMAQEQQEALNDLKRKNPEHLMEQNPAWQDHREEKIGWKVWKYIW